MSFLDSDYSQSQDNELMPAGAYEALIEEVQQGTSKNGKENIQYKLRIRKDLDTALPDTNGKQHNRVVFGTIWYRDKQDGKGYRLQPGDMAKVEEAVGIPDKTTFNSFEDFEKQFLNKAVKINVTINEYKNNMGEPTKNNQVNFWDYAKTGYPLDPNQVTDDAPNVSTDELPF